MLKKYLGAIWIVIMMVAGIVAVGLTDGFDFRATASVQQIEQVADNIESESELDQIPPVGDIEEEEVKDGGLADPPYVLVLDLYDSNYNPSYLNWGGKFTYNVTNRSGWTDKTSTQISASFRDASSFPSIPTIWSDTGAYVCGFRSILGGERYSTSEITYANFKALGDDLDYLIGGWTLVALWRKDETLTLNFDGGSGPAYNTFMVEVGGDLQGYKASNEPTKDGWEFEHWSETVGGAEATRTVMPNDDYTLYAVWDGADLTISANGGYFERSWQTSVSSESAFGTKLKDFEAHATVSQYWQNEEYTAPYGYEWGGLDLSGLADDHIINADTTLYIQWKYSVAYNKNGGKGSAMSNSEHRYGVSKDLSTNTYTRTGYNFIGWNTSSDGSGTMYGRGKNGVESVKNLDCSGTTDSTFQLYAIWEPCDYTIYIKNGVGGTCSPSEVTNVKYGENILDKLKAVSTTGSNGCAFKEWSVSGGYTTMPAEDVNVTAIWKALLTFDASGGKFSDNSTSITRWVTVGATAFSTTPGNPTREGYTFDGWYDAKSGGNALGTYPSAMPANSLTFYAQWNAYKTLTVDPNGGTVTINGTAYTSKQNFSVAEGASLSAYTPDGSGNNPARVGYTFARWTPANTTMPNSNLTITAQWTAITYTIKYDGNGGTDDQANPTASSTHIYDKPQALTTNGFTKTGYVFQGWATTATGAKVYDNKQEVKNLMSTAGTVTLYAVWEVDVYCITLELDGGSLTSSKSRSDLKFKDSSGMPNTANFDGTKIYYTIHSADFALPNHANGETIKIQKAGYRFMGWSVVSDINGEGFTSSDTYVSKVNNGSYGNGKIKAVWEAKEYTITLDLNGRSTTGLELVGEGNCSDWTRKSYNITNSIALPNVSKVARTGYFFEGWELCTDPKPTDNKETFWGDICATDGEYELTTSDKETLWGDIQPREEGYTRTTSEEYITEVKKGSWVDITFKAVWRPEIYNITIFMDNGSDNTIQGRDDLTHNVSINDLDPPKVANFVGLVIQYTIEVGFTLPNCATNDTVLVQRKGYIFQGWEVRTDIMGKGFTLDGSYAVSVDRGCHQIGFISAVWKAKDYQIGLNIEGESLSGGNPVGSATLSTGYRPTYGTINGNYITYQITSSSFGLPTSEHMSRTGYTFKGWSTANAGATDDEQTWCGNSKTDGDYTCTNVDGYATHINKGSWAHLTLTAIWEPLVYEIDVDLNDGLVNTNDKTWGYGLIFNDQSEMMKAAPYASFETNKIYYTIECAFALPNESEGFGHVETIFVQRKGWSFEGWQINSGDNISYSTHNDCATFVLRGSYGSGSITALWEIKEYTITLQMDGGSNISDYAPEPDANGHPKIAGNTITYRIDTPDFALPTRDNTRKDGYAFLAWEYDLNATSDPYNTWKGHETIDGQYYITNYSESVAHAIGIKNGSWSNITLTAVWMDIYEIELDLNRGYYNIKGNPARDNLYYNGNDIDLIKYANLITTDDETGIIYFTELTEEFVLPRATGDTIHVQRQGYLLKGWQIVSGDTIKYVDDGGVVIKVDKGSQGDGKLQAVWTEQVYTINLLLDNGAFEYNIYNVTQVGGYPKMYASKIEYRIDSETFALPENSDDPYMLKEGYAFVGWQDVTSLPADPYNTWVGAETIDGYYALTPNDEYVTHVEIGNWSTITLKAIWAKVYTLTIDVNYDEAVDIAGLNEYVDVVIPSIQSRYMAETRPSTEFPYINSNLSSAELNANMDDFSADYIVYYIEGNTIQLPIDDIQIGKRGYSLLTEGWSYTTQTYRINWSACPCYATISNKAENGFVKADWQENSYTLIYNMPVNESLKTTNIVQYTTIKQLSEVWNANTITTSSGKKYKLVGWATDANYWGEHNRDLPNYAWFGTDKIVNTQLTPYNARDILGVEDFIYIDSYWTYITSPLEAIGRFFDKDSYIQYTAHEGDINLYPVLTPVYEVIVHANSKESENAGVYKNGVATGSVVYTYEVDYFSFDKYIYAMPDAEAITPDAGASYTDGSQVRYRLGGDYYEIFWKYHVLNGYYVNHNYINYIYTAKDGWTEDASALGIDAGMTLMGTYAKKISETETQLIYNTDINKAFAPDYSKDTTIDLYPMWDEFTFNVNFYTNAAEGGYKQGYEGCITTKNEVGVIGAVKYGYDYGIAYEASKMAGLSTGYYTIDSIDIKGYTLSHASPYVVDDGVPTRNRVDKAVTIYKTGSENPSKANQWDYPSEETENEYYYKVNRQYWIDIEGYYVPNLYRIDFNFNNPTKTQGLMPELKGNDFLDYASQSGCFDSMYRQTNCSVGEGVDAKGNPITEIIYTNVEEYIWARQKVFEQGNYRYIYLLQDQSMRKSGGALQTSYVYEESMPKQWVEMPTWHLDYYELQYYYIHNPSDISSASSVNFCLYPTKDMEESDEELAFEKLSAKAPYDAFISFSQGDKWNLSYCADNQILNLYWYRRFINLDIYNIIQGNYSPNGYVIITETEMIADSLIDHQQHHLLIYMLNGDGIYQAYILSGDKAKDVLQADVPQIFNKIKAEGVTAGYVSKDVSDRLKHEQLMHNGWELKSGNIPIYIGNTFTLTAFDQGKDNTVNEFIGYRFKTFSSMDARFAGLSNVDNYADRYTLTYSLINGEKPTLNDGEINTDDSFLDKEVINIYVNFENIKYTLTYMVTDEHYNIQRYVDYTPKFGTLWIGDKVRDENGTQSELGIGTDATTIKYLYVEDELTSTMRVKLGTEFLRWEQTNIHGNSVTLGEEQEYVFSLDASKLRDYVYKDLEFSVENQHLNTIYAICQFIEFDIQVDVTERGKDGLVDSYTLGKEDDASRYIFTIEPINTVHLDATYVLKMQLDEGMYYVNNGRRYAVLKMLIENSNISYDFAESYPSVIEDRTLIITSDLLKSVIDYTENIEVAPNNRVIKFKVEVSPLLALTFVANHSEYDSKSERRVLQLLGNNMLVGEDGEDLIVVGGQYFGYKGQNISFKAIASEQYYSGVELSLRNASNVENKMVLSLSEVKAYTIEEETTITVAFTPKVYTFDAKIKYGDKDVIDIDDWQNVKLADGTLVFAEKPLIQSNVASGYYHYGDIIYVTAIITNNIKDYVELFITKNEVNQQIVSNKAQIVINGINAHVSVVISVQLITDGVKLVQSTMESGEIKTQLNEGDLIDNATLALVAGDKITVYVRPKVGYKFAESYDKSQKTTVVASEEVELEGEKYRKFVLFNSFDAKAHAGTYILNFIEIDICIEFEYDVIGLEEVVENDTYIASPSKDIRPGDKVIINKGEDPVGYSFDGYSYIHPQDTEGSQAITEQFTIEGDIVDYLSIGYDDVIKTQDVIVLKIYVNYIRQYKVTWSATPALASVSLKNDKGQDLQANRYYDRGTVVLARVETISPEHYEVKANITGIGEITTSAVEVTPNKVMDAIYTEHGHLSGFTKEIELNEDCHIELIVEADNYYAILKEKITYPTKTEEKSQRLDDNKEHSITDNIYYELEGTHDYGTKVKLAVYVVDPHKNTINTESRYYDLTDIKVSGLSVGSLEDIKTSEVIYKGKTCNKYEVEYIIDDQYVLNGEIELSYASYSLVYIKVLM